MEIKKTVGILYICTGKYVIFWRDFYLSMEKYFLPETEKHYFVFTDSSEIDFEQENKNIHRIYQEDLGWPNNTLKRFHIFLEHESIITQNDYLFFCNANLEAKTIIIEKEFLPMGDKKLLAVTHPGFFNKKRNQFTYDQNKQSTAYVSPSEGIVYVAGGLNGGITKDFIQAMKMMKENIDQDFKTGVIAKWHDESHWNRYLINRSDVKILDSSYLYPEGWNIPFDQKIIIRDKVKYGGHDFLRNIHHNNWYYVKMIAQKIKNYCKRFYL